MDHEVVDLSVNLGGLALKNPVMVASGTFGYGKEFAEFFDLGRLGAVMVKGVSLVPWEGNPLPRIVETPAGMLNAIGLQNAGVDHYLKEDLPFLRQFDTRIIVNVIGKTVEEYAGGRADRGPRGSRRLRDQHLLPQHQRRGHLLWQRPRPRRRGGESCPLRTRRPVIAKLSPNVTDVTEVAIA